MNFLYNTVVVEVAEGGDGGGGSNGGGGGDGGGGENKPCLSHMQILSSLHANTTFTRHNTCD